MKRRALWAKASLIAMSASGAAWTQPVPDSVPANPADFRLQPDGTVAPPAPAPAPPPPPVEPAPAPAPAPIPQDTPAPPAASENVVAPPTSAAPARRRSERRARTPAARPSPERTVEIAPVPANDDLAPPAPEPSATSVATPSGAAEPVATEPVAEPATSGSLGWLWPALGLAGLGALGFLLARRRGRAAVETATASEVEEPVEAGETVEPVDEVPAVAEPQVHRPAHKITVTQDPVAAAPVALVAGSVPRPQIDIGFRPAAAGATDAQASVDFALYVTNSGDAPARRVRMEARMFAMGQDHDAALADFFAAPLGKPTPIASVVAPGVQTGLRAQVTLPRNAVLPIQVRDRSLFVPLVAFNILYDWEDADGAVHAGQTAMSYVVGRENRPPAEKMAPFRLDQGPRIYREVGQRVHRLKQVA